jgi:hypothetical protein
MKKYLVVGGPVVSRTDGQEHYVSAKELCKLYRIPEVECVLTSSKAGIPNLRSACDHLIVLRPDPSGRYLLPEDPI